MVRLRCSREAACHAAATSLAVLAALGFVAHAGFALRLRSDATEQTCQRLKLFGGREGDAVAVIVAVVASICLASAWITYQSCFRLPPLWRSCRAWLVGIGLAAAVRELSKAVLQRARELYPLREEDPDAKRVREEFESRRMRRIRIFARRSCPLFLAALLFQIYQASFEDARAAAAEERHYRFLFVWSAVPMLVMTAPVALLDVAPSLATPRFVDCLNVLFTSVWAWRLAVSPDHRYDFDHHWLVVTRLVQASFTGNMWLSITLNAALFGVDRLSYEVRPGVQISTFERDAAVLVLTCLFIWGWEQFHWSEARFAVEARKSDQASALVQQMLALLCDAVPLLDSKLRLSEPCPGLATLLLRGGPIAKGACFVDLVSPEDSEQLRRCLAGSPSTPRVSLPSDAAATESRKASDDVSFAGLCHVHLRAVNNTQLPVSVFYSCAPDVDGLPHFLLGIRDDSEQGTSPAAMPAMLASSLSRQPAAAVPERPAPGRSDLSSSDWSVVSSGSGAEESRRPSVWVESLSSDLRVLSCSPGFALLGGPLGPCACLSEWLNRDEVTMLKAMIDLDDGTQQVVLRPPGVGVHYKCRVMRSMARAVPAAAAAAADPARLVFRVRSTDVERRQGLAVEG